MVNVNIEKLVSIKNYDAGVNGNLLVVSEDEVKPISIVGHKGESKDVQVLLCTAKVETKELQDELSEHVDEETSCNRVIVVSKKFLKLRNKKQLALLQIENSRASIRNQKTNVDGVISGEIDSIEKYGKWCTYRAVNKARRVREKSTKKATRWLHHDYKKDCKAEQKAAKAAEKAYKKNCENQESTIKSEPSGTNA